MVSTAALVSMFSDRLFARQITRLLRRIGHPLEESAWITERWRNYFGRSGITYEKQAEFQIRQKCPAPGCECEFVVRDNIYHDVDGILADVWDISKTKYTYDGALRVSCYVIGLGSDISRYNGSLPVGHADDLTAWRKVDNKYLCSRLVGLF